MSAAHTTTYIHAVKANTNNIVAPAPIESVALAVQEKYVMYEIKDIGVKVTVGRGPFKHYNFFVEQYNNDINRQENKYMIKIPAIWLMLNPNWCILIFCLFLSFVPFMCFLMFVLGIVRLICCLLARHKMNLNNIVVPNPFINMIKVPNQGIFCGKINEYYSFTTFEFTDYFTALGIVGEALNAFVVRCRSMFECKKPFKFMLYTDEFEKYYTEASKKMYLRDILSIVIIFFSLIGSFITSTIIEGYN